MITVASSSKSTAKESIHVCVFCSANDLADEYTKPAEELAKLIGKRGYNLVWGGSDEGLMKKIADSAQANGARLVGISMKLLEHKARKNSDEMIITPSLGERKSLMLSRSDAFVILVGGIGTLDEFMHTLELKKHGAHQKPIIILNTNGFYDPLRAQFQHMKNEGFISVPVDQIVFFATTPQQAIKHIDEALLKK